MSEISIVESITFYGIAFFVLIFVLLTIFAKNLMHSLLFSVISFICIGILFFSLNADYNAVIQIAVYGVAIPIVTLFAIMFTSSDDEKSAYISFEPRFFLSFISAIFLFMILWYLVKFAFHLNSELIPFFFKNKANEGTFDSLYAIAQGLYVDYRLAFILFAILILTVIIGLSVLNIIKEKRHG